MKKILSIQDKQEVLIQVLREHTEPGYAIFGISKEIANPLIKAGILHKDTYKYTGGCTLTKQFESKLF